MRARPRTARATTPSTSPRTSRAASRPARSTTRCPGSAQGYGGAYGDFAVAYIVAHEYGHQIQDELGLFERYGQQVPTKAFELQADCYAGTWAKSAADEDQLEDGDVEEALDAALAVGDFNASDPGHHGTPDERRAAWSAGFDTGDPAECGVYLDAA